MKISYNWLKEYVKKLPSPHVLAEKLTMAGLEVEGIEEMGKDIHGVVVAQIVSVDKHPNADRLTFCKVRTDKGTHAIVCGAKNMKPGDKVALALPGALLPRNVKIEKTKIRGIESEGMMCSEVELGIKDTSEGIMILPKDLPLGKDFTEALGLKDVILDINVTPNRPDCLSILGIAREIGAILNTPAEVTGHKIQSKIKSLKQKTPNNKLVTISIKEPSLCKRYSAKIITNITVGPSPQWLKRRLESLGYRSINNVVDVTNYVMAEYGQPLHAFDYDLIAGKHIVVRRAGKDERLQSLDNIERTLAGDMLVIADAVKPVALAGIMGGKETEISEATRNILLESAFFDPATVRRTSKKIGLSSESSYRFERGVDIEGVTRALDRAGELIIELAGGEIASDTMDHYPGTYKPPSIKARLSRVNKLLGTKIEKKDFEGLLNRLGILATRQDKDAYKLVPPSFRVDILSEIDIVEEIARLYGYGRIPTTLPIARLSSIKVSDIDRMKEGFKEILTNNGFLETISYSFISPQLFSLSGIDAEIGIRLSNPLTEEQSLMRQSLVPSLIETLRYNVNHYNKNGKFFEIGRVFLPKREAWEEREMVGGLISGLRYEEAWNLEKDEADFYDIKGIVERVLTGLGNRHYSFTPNIDVPFLHPGKGCSILVTGNAVGIAGEIHPDILQHLDIKQPAYVFELDILAVMKSLQDRKRYVPIPKFPGVVRDLAVIIDGDIPFEDLQYAIRATNTKILEDVGLFDVYYGENIPEGKRSLAIHFTYRSPERTLTEDEVNTAHTAILNKLKETFVIEVRGED